MHTCIDNCIHSFAGIQLRVACNRQMEALRRQYGPDYEQPTAVPMLTDLMARFPFTPVALTGVFPFAAN